MDTCRSQDKCPDPDSHLSRGVTQYFQSRVRTIPHPIIQSTLSRGKSFKINHLRDYVFPRFAFKSLFLEAPPEITFYPGVSVVKPVILVLCVNKVNGGFNIGVQALLYRTMPGSIFQKRFLGIG